MKKVSTALLNARDEIAYLKGKIAKLQAQLKPCNNKQESLYETIAFITHVVSAQTERYDELYRDLNQGMFGPWSLFIQWAKEFEEATKKREWGMDDGEDYIDALDNFIEMKLVLQERGTATTTTNGKAKIQKRGTNAKKVR